MRVPKRVYLQLDKGTWATEQVFKTDEPLFILEDEATRLVEEAVLEERAKHATTFDVEEYARQYCEEHPEVMRRLAE